MNPDVDAPLPPAIRSVLEEAQGLPRSLLAVELVEAFRAKRGIRVFGRALRRRDSGWVGRHL
jgi:hypothetical protein